MKPRWPQPERRLSDHERMLSRKHRREAEAARRRRHAGLWLIACLAVALVIAWGWAA